MTSWWEVPTMVAVRPWQLGAVAALAITGCANTNSASGAVPRAIKVLTLMKKLPVAGVMRAFVGRAADAHPSHRRSALDVTRRHLHHSNGLTPGSPTSFVVAVPSR